MTPLELVGLILLLLVVFVLPLVVKKVEHNLELFLFAAGCTAVTITGLWSRELIHEGAIEPIKITLAVLIAGILFRLARRKIRRRIWSMEQRLGYPLFAFLLVTMLGLLSSVITAIIAALVLAEVVSGLKLDRRSEVLLVVLACLAIGLGAALTPIGEPLSTIAVAKLKGEPYHAGFGYLLKLLGVYVVPGVLVTAMIAGFVHARAERGEKGLTEDEPEDFGTIVVRAGKVYLFVMALLFLGTGYRPFIDAYVIKLPWSVLFWFNSVSAILDNATLTAAEISPAMSEFQIRAALLGLLASGVGLIPGNIPNIISASKLGIGAREWAKWGVLFGGLAMLVYFGILAGVSG